MLNKASLRLAALFLMLGLLGFSGCGGGKTDLTAREVSDDQLALMMLSLEDYGPDFGEFVLDKESGPRTAKEAAEADFDAEEEARDLERFGWAAGYERSYLDQQSALDRSGIFVVSSDASLLASSASAKSYFQDSLTEMLDLGGSTREGITIEGVDRFDADVADEAVGWHIKSLAEGDDGTTSRIYMDGVAFRRGRLVASVGFAGFDPLEADEHLKGLASALDQRITEVLEEQAQGEEAPEPLVMRPGAVLATSGERFAQEVETFQGVFHSTIIDGGSHIGMEGNLAFRSPDTMYMTMDIMGETMEFLVVAADLYLRLPDEGWRVITDESIGLDRDALEEYLENRGPVDYTGTTAQLENLTQLPDDTLDGVTYLHYEGTLDIEELMAEMPEGIFDPAVLEQVRDFWEPMSVEVWLDKQTYLPHRMDEEVTLGVERSRFSMDMSMEFFGYNEPVDIPEPPADAEPLDLEDMGGL